VQADPGGHRPDAQRRGGLGNAEAVHRDQLEDGALCAGQCPQFLVQPPHLAGRVDLGHQTVDVVGLEQPAAGDQALGAAFPRGAAEFGGDHVARDPEQPRAWPAGRAAVPRGRLDRRQEHVGGQVGGQVRVGDAAGDEPGDLADVRPVEGGERGLIGPDGPDRRLLPGSHEAPPLALLRSLSRVSGRRPPRRYRTSSGRDALGS